MLLSLLVTIREPHLNDRTHTYVLPSYIAVTIQPDLRCQYTMATLKPTVLLIPGLWHTPECFNALRTELEEYGYETVSRQLPSIDCTDPSKHSAQSDADFVRTQLLLPLLDSGKRVVEVMHSYGGLPGSAAAYGLSEEERKKEGLKGGVVGLIFVASYVIPVEKTCSTCDDDTEHPPMVGFKMQEDVGTRFVYMRFGHGLSRYCRKLNILDNLGLPMSAIAC